MILASTKAKFGPTQIRLPSPNGKYACGYLHASEIPPSNLSGLNSFTSSPQISTFVCIVEPSSSPVARFRFAPDRG
ncbi:hypothetical protein K1719_002521 [Acacia pycnantha]|nr:hypothetical protein K1719_002521 [Acacia pycnantha]